MLNRYLTKLLNIPACYLITFHNVVNVLIKIIAHILYLDAMCVAIPDPIDLPKTIIFYSFHFPNFIKKFITIYQSRIHYFSSGFPL